VHGEPTSFRRGYRHDSAMAGMEIHRNVLVNHFKMIEVLAESKLVFSGSIHVIHQNVAAAVVELKDA